MRRRSVSLFVALLLCSVAGPAHVAALSTIVVNTTADELNTDGDCSLREAITAANTDAAVDACAAGDGADTISFSGLGFNAINVVAALPTITSDVTIDGAAQTRPINAGSAPSPTRILENSGFLTLRHVLLYNGSAPQGGAIRNDTGAALLVEDSEFDSNGPAESGGAIYNAGSLTIRRSEFDGNHTQALIRPGLGSSSGGAIDSVGTLTIESSTFFANTSGAVGGAISAGGTVAIKNSTFVFNNGGNFGGAIKSLGTLQIVASTIAGNYAALGGGGIEVTDLPLDTTISGSIVGQNNHGDCAGAITDSGYNIVGDGTCITAGTSQAVDPMVDFGSFVNGGATKTIPIKGASPAVDAVPLEALGCGSSLDVDQRSVSRPQNGACDIGAFERTPDTVAPNSLLGANPTLDLTDHNGWYTYDPAFQILATDPRPGLVDYPSGIAETRCLVDPIVAPASFEELSAACPLLGSGTQLADGIHQIAYASRDVAGNIEAIQTGTLKVDATPPTVSCPATLPTFLRGASQALLTATVTDATSGPASGTVSGPVDTRAIGPAEVILSGFDNAANYGFAVCHPIVNYELTFLQPGPGRIRPGSWVQVEVTLGDALAARISDAEGSQLAGACAVRVALDAASSTGSCATYDVKRDSFGFRIRTAKSLGIGQHAVRVEVWAAGVLVDLGSTPIEVGR
jgi:CSLREA domain-containing protein